jgi:hypothetical protein
MKTQFLTRESVREIANQLAFSIKVLIIGLFIPFSFVFGITYKRPDNTVFQNAHIRKGNVEKPIVNTVYLNPDFSVKNG